MGERAVTPRDAATIMLVRDAPTGGGGTGLQVCMLKRHIDSDFVGGAYVFPGGKVDDADRDARARSLCRGRDDAEASELLGISSGGLAFFVAAIRECFEESGVLLGYRGAAADDGRDPAPAGGHASREVAGAQEQRRGFSDAGSLEWLAARRKELNAGETDFVSLCNAGGITLAVDEVHYFSHWITPEGAPKRYDTRFFVAAMAAGQTPAHDSYETVDTVWVSPSEALERHKSGNFDLIFPTMKNLEAIGRFDTAGELLEAAKAIEHVPAVLPRVVADGNGIRILLPGDEGYDASVAPAAGAAAVSDIGAGTATPAMSANELDRVSRRIGLDGRSH